MLLVGIYFYKYNNKMINNINEIKINDVKFSFEIANDELERKKGLGGRGGLCDECGMLFIFDKAGQYGFWMKDMKFDIDILWIRDGKIVYIEKNVFYKTPEVIYKPDVESDMVLELNSGKVDEFGIRVEDKINF